MRGHAEVSPDREKRAIGPEIAPSEAAGALWWLRGDGREWGPFLTEVDGWRYYLGRAPLAGDVPALRASGWDVQQGCEG